MKNDSLKTFSIMKRIKAVTNQRGGGGGGDKYELEACDCRKQQKKKQSNPRRKLSNKQ